MNVSKLVLLKLIITANQPTFSDSSRYNNDPQHSATSSNSRNKAKPRSASADRSRRGVNRKNDNQFINVRNVMLSEDSGNSSLNTYTADSRKSDNSFNNQGDLSKSLKDWGNQCQNKQASLI